MSDDLASKHCVACEGGIPALEPERLAELLARYPAWQYDDQRHAIMRKYQFTNFHHTMAFVNAIAFVAHRENHHPDLEIGYNYCHVNYHTHAVNGVTENDFICVAKIEQLMQL